MKLYVISVLNCLVILRPEAIQVGEYIVSLLTRAREISNETFLKASAASFREAWRMVDTIAQVSSGRVDAIVPRTRAEDVV